MYEYPVLFPTISNRETWLQTVQIYDDQTGDLISLTDQFGNPLYSLFLEISASRHNHYGNPYGTPAAWYDDCGEPIITASLANYITIADLGTISIAIPRTIMQTLRGTKTYNVYLSLVDAINDDARQILIGKLPVAYGGRIPTGSNTPNVALITWTQLQALYPGQLYLNGYVVVTNNLLAFPWSNGGVLVLGPTAPSWVGSLPLSALGLLSGTVYLNGGVVGVVP